MKKHNTNQIISTKNNGKVKDKIILLIICFIGVLTITVGVLAMGNLSNKGRGLKLRKLRGTSQQIIHRAILNTQDKLDEERRLLEEKSGGEALERIFKTEATDMNFNVKVKGLNGIENEDIINAVIKDINLQGNLASTKDHQYLKTDIKMKQAELELVGVTLYKVNQEFGVDSPKILENPYAFKGETFFEDLRDSALYRLVGGQSSNEAQLQDVKEVLSGTSHLKDLFSLSNDKEYTDKNNKLYEYTIKELDITKRDKTERNYDVYECTLTSEQIARFNKEQMAHMMELGFAEDIVNLLAKYLGVTKEEFVEKVTNESTYEDVAIKFEFYIDEYFVRSATCTMINHTYDEEMLRFSFDLGDKVDLLSELQWEVRAGEGVQVKVACSNNLAKESDILEKNFNIELTSYGEKGFVSYKTAYDLKVKENNYTANFEATLPYIGSAVITGKGTKVVSDKEVSTTIEELKCKLKDTDANEIQAKLALQYGVKAISAKEAEFKSKEQAKYILELSEEELISILQKIQAHLGGVGITLLQ